MFSRISPFFYDPCIVGKLERRFFSLRRKMSQGRTGKKRRHEMCGSFSSSSSSLLFRRSHKEIFSFFSPYVCITSDGESHANKRERDPSFFASTKILCAQKSGRKLGPKNITRISFSSCVSGRKRGKPPQTPFASRKLTPPIFRIAVFGAQVQKSRTKKRRKCGKNLGEETLFASPPIVFFLPIATRKRKIFESQKDRNAFLYPLRETYFSTKLST